MPAEGGAGYCSDITRCVVTGEPTAEMAEVYGVLHEAQAAAVAAGHARAWRPRTSTPPPATSSPTPATASGSSTAPATASGSRSTRTPTSSAATTGPSWSATPTRSSPGIYLPDRFGFRLEDIVVTTAHGPRAAQPRRPPPGPRRRLTPPRPPDDRLRRRLPPAAVGHRRPAVPLGHHPPPRGVARLRLADAGHLRPDGRRRAPTSGSSSSSPCRCATSPRSGWPLASGVALASSIVRRRPASRARSSWPRPAAPGWRP